MLASLQGLSEDDIYFNTAKVSGYEIRGKQISNPFVYSYSVLSLGELMLLQADTGGGQVKSFKMPTIKATSFVVNHFSRKSFNASPEQKDVIDHLKMTILAQFKKRRLSLFGLIHAFELMQMGEPPCDEKIYGLNTSTILRMLSKYVNYSKSQYVEFIRKIEQEDFGDEYTYNPNKVTEMPKKLELLGSKLRARYGDTDQDLRNNYARIKKLEEENPDLMKVARPDLDQIENSDIDFG